MTCKHSVLSIQRITYFSIFLAVLFLENNVYAQVTIGSDQKPSSGALLDLKQNPDGTSTKGMGLPRVLLTSLKIPDNETSLSATIDGATSMWDKDEHIGLMVYNVSEYDKCDSYTFRPGPYVWNGESWERLGIAEKEGPGVKTYIDTRDGERYLYRRFGDAGEWMLEHLRYVPRKEDYPDMPNFPTDIQAGYESGSSIDKLYYYPNADASTPGVPPTTWRPNQGILYTFSAATLGVQDEETTNQGVTEYDPEAGGPLNPIQGVCPPGWHIPSDKEWSMLEKEIYNNANQYSQYSQGNGLPFDPEEWDPSWETDGNGPRGASVGGEGNIIPGHGYAMLSQCPPIGSTTLTEGKSLSALKGGFDIILSGAAMGGMFEGYGLVAAFWTSSVAEEEGAWARLFMIGDGQPQQVGRMPYERIVLTSVRCKR